MVSSLTSQVKTGVKKNPVCETMVWPLTFRSKTTEKKNGKNPGPRDQGMVPARSGQKPEHRPPLSIKLPLIDGQWTPGLELLPFRSLKIQWRGTEGGNSDFFYLDVGVRRSKPEFAPIRSAPSNLWRSGRQQF